MSFSWLNNIPLCGQTTFYLSIHLLMDLWVISTFWLLWMMLLHVTWCTNISLKPCFQYIPRGIIPGSYVNSIFSFLRSHWLFFLLHQQCTRIPISAHPCQHLLFFKKKNLSIFFGWVRSYVALQGLFLAAPRLLSSCSGVHGLSTWGTSSVVVVCEGPVAPRQVGS